MLTLLNWVRSCCYGLLGFFVTLIFTHSYTKWLEWQSLVDPKEIEIKIRQTTATFDFQDAAIVPSSLYVSLTFHDADDVCRVSFRYQNWNWNITVTLGLRPYTVFILKFNYFAFWKNNLYPQLLCCTAPVAARSRKMGREIVPPDIKLNMQKYQRNALYTPQLGFKN